MKNTSYLGLAALLALFVTGCTQSTPTMMNVSPAELSHETSVELIPLKDVDDVSMAILAEHHRQHGTGPLELTMTYNPKARDFTAMKAVHKLKEIEQSLKYKGVKNMTTQTLPVPDGKPSLMVSYDMVNARPPSDCTPMPGLDNNETGRFIGDYKFGCGVETLLSKQIARPSDLEGKSEMDTRTARRDAIVVEEYSAGVPREPLQGIERADLSSQ